MTLKVIGAGLGRTGTLSLKTALEELGFGPCHHMMELLPRPERHRYWEDAALQRPVAWDKVFEGFSSTVDWPYCNFYRELAGLYPDAKVILTVREPDAWFDSISRTIFPLQAASAANPSSPLERASKVMIWDFFDGRLEDRDHVIAVYEKHNRAVKAAIPPERLLTFDVREGWAPLCQFLGVPVPAAAFPRVNIADEFKAKAETFARQAKITVDDA
jgi:hypothetical protein